MSPEPTAVVFRPAPLTSGVAGASSAHVGASGVPAGSLVAAGRDDDERRTAGYAAGSVTTATEAWFFAAARTIAGPPMSICSTHSSASAPEATVAWNG